MSDHRSDFPFEGHPPDLSDAKTTAAENAFILLDECLSTLPDDAPQAADNLFIADSGHARIRGVRLVE